MTMIRPDENDAAPGDQDERLGEAIEAYLALIEQGNPPGPEDYAARFPDLREDILSAIEGLELVSGLVGQSTPSPYGSPGRNLESGRRIAGYRVVRELGRGGMGTVYEAVHVGLDRPVALKVLGSHAAPDSSARRRFLNEARTAAALHHTHIVPVFDVGQAGGLCYYAMQRIEGSGLDRLIRHLRATRCQLGHGPIGGNGTSPRGGRESSSSSGFSSRFSRLLVHFSKPLSWRPARPSRAADDGPLAGDGGGVAILEKSPTGGPPPRPAAPAKSPRVPPSLDAILPISDSTASWLSLGQPRGGTSIAGQDPGLGALASPPRGKLAPTLGRGRDEDEPPPALEPPRGSAYCRWVAEVGLQAAEALAHAHHHGVIHRDVKPSNLLIDAEGTIWVTDFGLARRLADPGLTHQDSLLGTPRYMSPEQARTGRIDGRTDVYSLGATLYELLTLRPPFDGGSAAELLDQIGNRDPIPPRAIDRRIPRDLETVILKALAKRPADRYPSATALAEDLARFLNREPVRARRISPVGRFWRVARRHPGISLVTTAAGVAILAIATYSYVRILAQRNLAIQAGKEKDDALNDKQEEANKARAAARWALAANAANLLVSDLPDRRSRGLDLLRRVADPEKAVELDQEQALTPARLRDQAVEFLVLRDVQPRPGFETGPSRGLEFGPGGTILAALSEDGQEIGLWNVEQRQRLEVLALGDARRAAAPAAAGRDEVRAPGADVRAESGSQAERPRTAAATGQAKAPGSGGPAPPPRRFYMGNRMAIAGPILAAIGPEDDGLRLFDIRTASPLQGLARPGRKIQSVLANPAGERLLTIESVPRAPRGPAPAASPTGPPRPPDSDVEFVLWDLNRLAEPVAVLWHSRGEGPRRGFATAAFSPDGRTVAIASSNGAGTTVSVALFEAADGRASGQVETQAETLSALALGASSIMATASGNTIQLWDREAGKFLTSLTSTRGVPRLMRFNEQGNVLAVASGPNLELWDIISHKILAVLPASDWISDLSFTPDGRSLAVGGRMTTTAVWQIADPAARLQLGGFESWPVSLAYGDRGALAIGTGDGNVLFYRDGKNHCRSAAAGPGITAHAADPSARGDRERERERERNRRTSVTFDAVGRLIAHDARGLRIWKEGSAIPSDPEVIALPPTPPGPWGSQTLLARSPNGQQFVLVRASDIALWRADQPERFRTITPPAPLASDEPPPNPRGAPWGLPRSANAGAGGRPAGEPKRREGPMAPGRPPRPNVFAIQFDPGTRRIYVLGDFNRLHLWSLGPEEGDGPIQATRLLPADRLPDEFTSMALRPDGSLLALGDRYGSVTLLDTHRLRVVGKLAAPAQEAPSMFFPIAFSPDGRRLAVGSAQGTITVWNLEDLAAPRIAIKLPGQRGMVTSLAFDPQVQRLASSSVGTESVVEVWDLSLLSRELARLGLPE